MRLRVLGSWVACASSRLGSSRHRLKPGPRLQVIVEKADKSDIPDIDKKKCVCVPGMHMICGVRPLPPSPMNLPQTPVVSSQVSGAR